MPRERRTQYEDYIKSYLKKHCQIDGELTAAGLQMAVNIQYQTVNRNYIPGPQLVIDSLGGDDTKIAYFVRDWRAFFMEMAHPEFLPTGWSIHSSVECDIRNQLNPSTREKP